MTDPGVFLSVGIIILAIWSFALIKKQKKVNIKMLHAKAELEKAGIVEKDSENKIKTYEQLYNQKIKEITALKKQLSEQIEKIEKEREEIKVNNQDILAREEELNINLHQVNKLEAEYQKALEKCLRVLARKKKAVRKTYQGNKGRSKKIINEIDDEINLLKSIDENIKKDKKVM